MSLTSPSSDMQRDAALAAALEALGVAYYAKDGEGRYLALNALAGTVLGIDPTGAMGRTDAELLPATLAASMRAADHAAHLRSGPSVGEQTIEAAGKRRDYTAVRLPYGDNALVGLWFERSEQRRVEAQLQQALNQLEDQQRAVEQLRGEAEGRTQRETVLGLYQREQFEDHLRREVDLSLREHREFAVVAVALDPVPADTPPHAQEGRDRVLESLGRLLRGNTRAMDAPCRLENERFAVLLSGVGLATAHARMESVRRQCSTQLVPVGGVALRFTVSMGVASFPHTAQTQSGLLSAAEAALAEAKRRGGNHVSLASIPFGAAG